MPPEPTHSDLSPHSDRWFPSTHWSVVLAAGETTCPQAQQALEKLCQAYWYPLYAFVRRSGSNREDAQDLTQELFAQMVARDSLRGVGPEKGRFRSFLLVCMKHLLSKEYQRARRQKRGGGAAMVPLDAEPAEDRYGADPGHEETPEKLFERTWALEVMGRAMSRLRQECLGTRNGTLFEELKSVLSGEKDNTRYRDIAARLNMTEAAIKQAVRRLRERYRESLRAEIADTVASSDEIDSEIRHLLSVLRG